MTDRAACCQQDEHERWMFLYRNPLRQLVWRTGPFFRRHLSRGGVAADLGCSAGFFTFAMADVVGTQGTVHAIDPYPKAIRSVEATARRRGYTNVRPHTGSAANQKWIADGSLDFVMANLVLCCMVDHDGAINEIRRTLKPTGIAYLSVARNPGSGSATGVDGREWRAILRGFSVRWQRRTLLERKVLVSLPA